MDTVTPAYAKDHLDELLARAAAGEEVSIVDPERGAFRLTAASTDDTAAKLPKKRVPGRWKGRLNIPDDKLLEPMSEEELALWYGDDA